MLSKFLKHLNLTSLNPQSLTTNELVVYIVLRYMHHKTTPRHLFKNKHHLLIPHVQLRSLIPTRHMRYCSRSWWTLRVVECHIPQGLETYGGKHCGFPFWLCKKKCNVGSYWKENGIIYDNSVWVDKMENGDLYVLSYVYLRYNIHMAGGMRLKLQTLRNNHFWAIVKPIWLVL